MKYVDHRVHIKVPKDYYEELRKVQEKLSKQQNMKIPLWRCIGTLEREKERWHDDEWFR